MVYGEPRLTHDIDLVLRLGRAFEPETFAGAFPPSEFYTPPAEVIRLEASRGQRGHFNVIHQATGFKGGHVPRRS
jgi:hypothetical protein